MLIWWNRNRIPDVLIFTCRLQLQAVSWALCTLLGPPNLNRLVTSSYLCIHILKRNNNFGKDMVMRLKKWRLTQSTIIFHKYEPGKLRTRSTCTAREVVVIRLIAKQVVGELEGENRGEAQPCYQPAILWSPLSNSQTRTRQSSPPENPDSFPDQTLLNPSTSRSQKPSTIPAQPPPIPNSHSPIPPQPLLLR